MVIRISSIQINQYNLLKTYTKPSICDQSFCCLFYYAKCKSKLNNLDILQEHKTRFQHDLNYIAYIRLETGVFGIV